MSDARWDRIKQVFALASDAQGAERNAIIERECAGDAELRREVESLLLTQGATQVQTGDGARAAATIADRFREGPGTRIGPYKLLQAIGEGGFGSVFLAEQTSPVTRKVAIKIIKLGMDTKAVVARFEQERQALALMDHPNIAKVLDAGATETGRPYFVMELVKGDPVTDYCDKHNLGIRERLNLFAQVCLAVQHAHQKGIIHRDIKPSNVLVSTQDGRPAAKIIDFGIAKATASKLTEKTLFTEHKQLIGTPEYMSPEQAEGSLDIDTRTDVYSLGVLLYELLTGTTPFSGTDLRSAAFGEIQRIIREVEPPKPSTRLSQSTETIAGVAARRATEPRKLGTVIRGELDWIVMKALDKDRARRYETANGLASDIERYLTGEAVVAAPPGKVYRLRKLIRRNRGAVVTGGLVAAALVLGIIGTTIGLLNANKQRLIAISSEQVAAKQKELAEDRLKESEATVNFLDNMLGAADPSAQGKDVTVRSVLDRAAKSLSGQYTDKPLIAARLHGTLGKTYYGLGEYNAAESHTREALILARRALGEDDAFTCETLNSLAAVLLKKAQFAEVEDLLTKALKKHEQLFGRKHEITVMTLDFLTQLYVTTERRQEALTLARELLETRIATIGRDRIETISAMNTLALLYGDLERFDESIKLYEEAIEISGRVNSTEHPLTLEMRGNLALVCYGAAMRIAQSDPEGYRARLAKARTIGEDVVRARTRILGPEHSETLNATGNLASVYKELGLFDLADEIAAKDIEISIRTLGEDHPDTIVSLANMGNSYRSRKKYDEAVKYLERALKGARKSHPRDFQGTAFILGWYGSSLGALGRYAEGEPMLLEARGIISRTLGEKHEIAKRMARDLQQLYEGWNKAEPGKGHDSQAAEWKAKQEQSAK